jgi:hypothetical protein
MMVSGHISTDRVLAPYSVAEFDPGHNGDPSCWWFPTEKCLRRQIDCLEDVTRVTTNPKITAHSSIALWAWRA